MEPKAQENKTEGSNYDNLILVSNYELFYIELITVQTRNLHQFMYICCHLNIVRDYLFVKEIKAKRTLNTIFIVLVEIDQNAQYFSGDNYDLYESNYPLQEQKRLVKTTH